MSFDSRIPTSPMSPMSPRSPMSPKSPRSSMSPKSPRLPRSSTVRYEIPLKNCDSPLKKSYLSSSRNHESSNTNNDLLLTKSISTILLKNRENIITSFLIILTDDHYKKRYFRSKSYYDNLKSKEYLFPGVLDIINIKELKTSKEFIIKDNVLPKQLYIKLPRENIYVLSDIFYESYFQSQMNELIRIFTTLKAETIDIHIHQDNTNNSVMNIHAGTHYTPVDLEVQYSDVKKEHNKMVTIKNMVFKNNEKNIDINDFTVKKNFYYLPNQDEWQDIIRNRIKKSMIKDTYYYTYENNMLISKELIAELKIFNIGFKYNIEKNKNITMKYKVKYFPLNKEQLLTSPSVSLSPNKKRNSICENEIDDDELNNSKNGFLYRLFEGILF